ESRAPLPKRIARLAHFRAATPVHKALVASFVVVQVVRLVGKVRNGDIEQAIAVEISKVNTHRTKLLSLAGQRNTRQESYFFKSSVMIVVVHIIWPCVVGNVQVRPPIVIVIAPNCPQPIVFGRVAYSSFP